MSNNYHHGWKYKRWQKAVLKQDNFQCVLCGSVSNLTADHILPRVSHPSLIFDPSNGRTLCDDCRVKDMLHALEKGLLKRSKR